MKINNKFIVVCGFLDFFLIGWIFINDIFNQRIPIYSNMMTSIVSAAEFELNYGTFSALSVVAAILLVSVIFSGFLMLRCKKFGIYLSFFQAPFRFLLIIQPTFFFIVTLGSYIGISYFVATILIVVLEILKIVGQVFWLKRIN